MYLEANQNYVKIVEFSEGKVSEELLRISLTKALEQIKDENIVQCHRSYAVNLKAIKKVSGNSQGLKLTLIEENQTIPVSKSYQKKLKHSLTDKKNLSSN